MQSATMERKPYRIIRGQFSRREGDPKVHVDPETGGKDRQLRTREFVHYSARNSNNPTARDEVMLTETEAAVLGNRVVPLFGNGVRTKSTPKTVDELIALGLASHGPKSFQEWREMVFEAGVLPGAIPHKKAELLAALRKASAEQQQSSGPAD